MKVISLSFSTLGVLCLIMAIFTVFEIAPSFIEIALIGARMSTTVFWGGLAILLFLAGIAFGIVSKEDFGPTAG
ncbi:MAG: hypothetical protein KAI14_05375 [Dehalococcoidales bacterium]|nr:hypothetical protein [Dehalococcoidales bacterium]